MLRFPKSSENFNPLIMCSFPPFLFFFKTLQTLPSLVFEFSVFLRHLVKLAEWVEISRRTSGISYLTQALRSQESH